MFVAWIKGWEVFFRWNFDATTSLPFSNETLSFKRFRQEYRLERKLLAELDVDPTSHQEELSGLFATNDPVGGRHNISRVVVLHNDKIETFGNPEQSVSNPNDFFDSDSFWSGSITWY